MSHMTDRAWANTRFFSHPNTFVDAAVYEILQQYWYVMIVNQGIYSITYGFSGGTRKRHPT